MAGSTSEAAALAAALAGMQCQLDQAQAFLDEHIGLVRALSQGDLAVLHAHPKLAGQMIRLLAYRYEGEHIRRQLQPVTGGPDGS